MILFKLGMLLAMLIRDLKAASQVKIEIKLLHKSLVLIVHCDAKLGNICAHCIVRSAIGEHQFHVVHELTHVFVFVFLKLCFDRCEIHRAFN